MYPVARGDELFCRATFTDGSIPDEDPDIARHCLETLVELSTGGVSANSAAFIGIEGSVDLLLDLLAQQVTARSQPRPQRPAAAAQ